MNTLDVILLLCFLPGILRGFSKGLLSQVLSLAGIIVSVWMAFRFMNLLCAWLQGYLDVSETVLNVVSFAVILVVVSLGVALLAKLLTKVVELAMLGWLNKLLGAVLSVGVTALVLGVLIVLVDTLQHRFGLIKTDILETSVLYGTIRDGACLVFPYLKELLLKS